MNYREASFGGEADQALMDWAQERWELSGMRVGSKLIKPGLPPGLFLAGVCGAAIGAVSGGSGWLLALAASMPASQLLPVMVRSWMAWAAARDSGKGRMGAFSAMSARLARALAVELSPLPAAAALAYGGSIFLRSAAARVDARLAGAGAAGRIADAASAAASGAARWSAAAKLGWEGQKRWKAGQAQAIAILDGSESTGHAVYQELAQAHYRRRWGMGGAEAVPQPGLPGGDGEATRLERGQVERYGAFVADSWADRASFREALGRAAAAGVEPWFRPGDGLPALAELAASAKALVDSLDGGSAPDDDRLASMRARCEEQELGASVGESRLGASRGEKPKVRL